MRETTFEFCDYFDTVHERAVALHAASLVGVPAEVIEAVRSAPATGQSAAEWLAFALEVNRGWRRAA